MENNHTKIRLLISGNPWVGKTALKDSIINLLKRDATLNMQRPRFNQKGQFGITAIHTSLSNIDVSTKAVMMASPYVANFTPETFCDVFHPVKPYTFKNNNGETKSFRPNYAIFEDVADIGTFIANIIAPTPTEDLTVLNALLVPQYTIKNTPDSQRDVLAIINTLPCVLTVEDDRSFTVNMADLSDIDRLNDHSDIIAADSINALYRPIANIKYEDCRNNPAATINNMFTLIETHLDQQ